MLKKNKSQALTAEQRQQAATAEFYNEKIFDLYTMVKSEFDVKKLTPTPSQVIAHTALHCADNGIPIGYTVMMMVTEFPLEK